MPVPDGIFTCPEIWSFRLSPDTEEASGEGADHRPASSITHSAR